MQKDDFNQADDTVNNQENETTDQTADEMSKSDLTFEK